MVKNTSGKDPKSKKTTKNTVPRRGGKKVHVKTAHKRTNSSTRWLQRQLNDPYVAEAQRLGYKSRAAFKILQIDEKCHIFKSGQRIVDLGAAPGGWTQVAATQKPAKLVALDILEMDPVSGAVCIQKDIKDDDAPDILKKALGGQADLVLSDMAADTTGHPPTDHIRTVALFELALDFALDVMAPGGTFVAKVFKGGTERQLLDQMKKSFTTVKHVKPDASRSESPETYVVAMGFKGA